MQGREAGLLQDEAAWNILGGESADMGGSNSRFHTYLAEPSQGNVESPSTPTIATLDERYPTLNTGLAALLSSGASAGETGDATSRIAGGGVTSDGKYVLIDASAKDGDGALLLTQLQAIGLQDGASFANMVGGALPIGKLDELVGIADLGFASEAVATTSAGKVTSAGDALMNADVARSTYNVSGSGITVGVISDSFNHLGGMATDKSTGDLPSSTTILKDYSGSDATDEGRAMAQIVHDIAPGSSIMFETAYSTQAQFANAIIDLANHGAKVIVDDVMYFAEPAYQDGIVAQAVEKVEAMGVTYVSAAGNNGDNGFESPFVYSGHSATVAGRSEQFAQMSTTSGTEQFTRVQIDPGSGAYFVLQWAQPSISADGGKAATSDLDLFLYNYQGTALSTLDKYSSSSEHPYAISNNIGGDPMEVMYYFNDTSQAAVVDLAVGLHSGAAPADFKVMVLANGNDVFMQDIDDSPNMNEGTVYGHTAAEGAISVGAVNAFFAPPDSAEQYSSAGPTNIYFDAAGNLLSSPDVRETPSLLAPDSVATTVAGFSTFAGTSAAAPHVAGVAALMLQANSHLNGTDVLHLMQDAASRVTFSSDSTDGAGFLDANVAVQYAETLIIPLENRSGYGGLLTAAGTHLNDTFTGNFGQDHIVDGGAGTDTLDYSDIGGWVGDQPPANVMVDVAAGLVTLQWDDGFIDSTDTFASIEVFKGGASDDVFIGGALNDVFYGGGGNDTLGGNGGDDTLNGGLGADKLTGGAGHDTFVFSTVGDSGLADGTRDVITDFQQGVDRLDLSGIAGFHFLGDGGFDGKVDALHAVVADGQTIRLEGDLNGDKVADFAIDLTGQFALNPDDFKANSLVYVPTPGITQSGDSGDNTLTGGMFDDTLKGADGNDVLIGNQGADVLEGGIGNDVLAGGSGNDTLDGGDGADVLDGGAGVDKLTGGAGADTFVVAAAGDTGLLVNARDIVTDFQQGTDRIDLSQIGTFHFLDAGSFDGKAGALHTVFTATQDTKVEGDIDGDKVADFAIELTGKFTLTDSDFTAATLGTSATGHVGVTQIGDSADNTLTGSAFDDTLKGMGGNDTLIGNEGNDILDGGTGADKMTGGGGNDTYYVDDPGDTVTEVPSVMGGSSDTVNASIGYVLPSGVENLTLTGSGDIAGTGNELDNTIVGNQGDNTLDGGAGIDKLTGGAGADTFVLSAAGDTGLVVNARDIVTDFQQGLDKLDFSAIGKFDFLGAGAFDGHAYELHAVVTATQDIKVEGDTNGDKIGDFAIELTGLIALQNTDFTSDTLVNPPTPGLYLVGDGGDNTLTGGGLNDTLNGGGGNDTLIGNDGDDVLDGGAGIDKLTGGAGADTFVLSAAGDTGLVVNARDVVTDFQQGLDKLDFSAIGKFNFLGAGAFDGHAYELHTVVTATHDIKVEGDINGDKIADFAIELTGQYALTANDFTVRSLATVSLSGGSGHSDTSAGRMLSANDVLDLASASDFTNTLPAARSGADGSSTSAASAHADPVLIHGATGHDLPPLETVT
jgi:Ca2+-binding RTX toxin-like protein